jgi:Glutamine amidotransferases class-II
MTKLIIYSSTVCRFTCVISGVISDMTTQSRALQLAIFLFHMLPRLLDRDNYRQANSSLRFSHLFQQILRDAQTLAERMYHRGACACDNDTGDGAGVMTAIPHQLYTKEL